MSSFARLSAALGTAAILATAGLGSVYADTQTYIPAVDATAIQTDAQVINHWQTITTTYACPSGHALVRLGTDPIGNAMYYTPLPSEFAVEYAASTLGNWNLLGPQTVSVTWTNWALSGNQWFSAIYDCTGNLDPLTVGDTASTQPTVSPTPQATPSPTAQPTAAVSLTNLTDFQRAFNNLLPTLGGTGHSDPSAGLMPGIQTPPNTAALGRQLVRVYATPQVIKSGQVLTLTAACPSGGLVTADPGVRSALPYVSRVTNVNVWSSLASGDVGQNSLGFQFTNKSSNNELAAFQFVCSVPN